ncbi:hypothetical protein BC832DRAFT_601261 [Gaertneriomyces semiglobifer]|nr:hypothetical protein BC832DRAFT_601261 [Gaertneriomyces semiglobifer]
MYIEEEDAHREDAGMSLSRQILKLKRTTMMSMVASGLMDDVHRGGYRAAIKTVEEIFRPKRCNLLFSPMELQRTSPAIIITAGWISHVPTQTANSVTHVIELLLVKVAEEYPDNFNSTTNSPVRALSGLSSTHLRKGNLSSEEMRLKTTDLAYDHCPGCHQRT